MNNYIVINNNLDYKLDRSISFNNNNNIDISNDSNLLIRVDIDTSLNINISDNSSSKIVVVVNNSTTNLSIKCLSNSKCDFIIFGSNISGNISINLDGDNSSINMYNSSLNNTSNKQVISINHNCSNTSSNIYNHGCTYNNGSLEYLVNGIVPKSSSKCVCNQDNMIINMTDNICNIHPNLLIDNYDVIANHSAYIGKFKSDIVFYMMSRGIDINTVNKILLKAFLIGNLNIESNLLEEFNMVIERSRIYE